MYFIFMDGEQVHCTKDQYQRDMFIAELKARIKLIEAGVRDGNRTLV